MHVVGQQFSIGFPSMATLEANRQTWQLEVVLPPLGKGLSFQNSQRRPLTCNWNSPSCCSLNLSLNWNQGLVSNTLAQHACPEIVAVHELKKCCYETKKRCYEPKMLL